MVGGNKFDGNYNPMGNPTYTQVYTDAVRKFNILDDGINLSINMLAPWNDASQFHRRDYNAVAQILPNGEEGITAFSGVFQPTMDLPFLTSVTMDSSSYAQDNAFQQFYNHYHCAVLPIYDQNANAMHTLFFGGIAQFFDSAGVLVQDNNVPFVKTIARVSRDASGQMAEYKLPIEMPALLGAGAEFIPNLLIPHYPNEVFNLNQFTNDTTLVGYIYGGIHSTGKNIFFSNGSNLSSASSQLFKVFVIKNTHVGIDELNTQSKGTLDLKVYPNPNHGEFVISFYLKNKSKVKLQILNENGQLLKTFDLNDAKIGLNELRPVLNINPSQGALFVLLESEFEKAVRKIKMD
ncbi:MAG: T9SS type A sorting domain-containing protein [Chitinophagaceae bacterium]